MDSDAEQRALEAEFVRSWDRMEEYFDDQIFYCSASHMEHMLILIGLLREQGYDRHFRAGQIAGTFILSRSLEDDLRQGQPFLVFGVGFNGELMVTLSAPNVNVSLDFESVKITPELENLLMPLLVYPLN